jgi:acetolactate synthase-1/3 small subunit
MTSPAPNDSPPMTSASLPTPPRPARSAIKTDSRLDAKKDSHTIALLVRNSPGVLVRVSMVFSRRGYNIESLVVSPGARSGFSRMTVTCSGDPSILEQMIKQLSKLVDVVHALDHTTSDRFETEIALIKIRCDGDARRDALEIAEHFNARVVDYATESIILRVFGDSDKLDAMIALLDEERIVEIVRSGKIVMARALEVT